MMSPTTALKLTVPVVFFGYALAANLALFSARDAVLPDADGLLTGGVSQAIDSLYRDSLPHMDPSVGLIGAARYLVLGEGRPGVIVGQDGVLFTAEEARPAADAPYIAALTRIERAAAALDTAGVTLVVVPLPAKLDLLRSRVPDGTAGEVLAALYHRFLEDLGALGLAAVDTRPALAGLPGPFLATDTHWTPDGARSVAASVAASGAVPMGDDIFAVDHGATATFAGDLVTYVTSDTLAPLLGLAPETVAPYRAVPGDPAPAEDGLIDIFGTAGGAVDLVGTSYSANVSWSFAEALKLELRRDVINHAEEGQGPFTPMQTYIESLDPLALPEAVIWEIPVRYLTDPALLTAEGLG